VQFVRGVEGHQIERYEEFSRDCEIFLNNVFVTVPPFVPNALDAVRNWSKSSRSGSDTSFVGLGYDAYEMPPRLSACSCCCRLEVFSLQRCSGILTLSRICTRTCHWS